MNLKKLTLLTLAEIIFFAIIILGLIFVRIETKSYVDKVQLISPQLASLKENLAGNNLSAESQVQLTDILNQVDSVTGKVFLLNNILLPIAYIIISIIFQLIYWKLAANTNYKRIFIPIVIQTILLLFTAYFGLNFISYLLMISGSFTDIIYFILTSILLTLSTLFNFYYFATNKPAKEILNIWANVKKVLPEIKFLFINYYFSLLIQYAIAVIITIFLYNAILYLINILFTLFILFNLIILISAIDLYHYSTNPETRIFLEFFFNIPILMFFFLILITLAILSYVFIQVKIAITAPLILLAIFSLFANMHRIYIINKIRNVSK